MIGSLLNLHIAGTTEHGSVGPLKDILEMRTRLEARGMSFMVHADAAWGGYFATKVERPPKKDRAPVPSYAFSIPLSRYTNEQLACLRDVE